MLEQRRSEAARSGDGFEVEGQHLPLLVLSSPSLHLRFHGRRSASSPPCIAFPDPIPARAQRRESRNKIAAKGTSSERSASTRQAAQLRSFLRSCVAGHPLHTKGRCRSCRGHRVAPSPSSIQRRRRETGKRKVLTRRGAAVYSSRLVNVVALLSQQDNIGKKLCGRGQLGSAAAPPPARGDDEGTHINRS